MPAHPDGRLKHRALDPAFELSAAQVEAGTVRSSSSASRTRPGSSRREPGRRGTRLGTDAVCLLASITKPIVATAVMRQVEAGRIDLAEPLTSWLPEARLAGPPFSAWHVLSHTSGLAEFPLEGLIARGADRAALLRATYALEQATAPGTHFEYASSPFDVLAEAVARRLGTPFESILRDEVLEPLGMTATTFDPWADGSGPDRARPRRPRVTRGIELDVIGGYTGSASPAARGGARSATSCRFGRAMLRDGELDGARVLSRPFVRLMTGEVTVGGLRHPTRTRYLAHVCALGWGRPGVASPASPASFGHGGASGTRLWVDPEHDLVLAYLFGSWGLPLRRSTPSSARSAPPCRGVHRRPHAIHPAAAQGFEAGTTPTSGGGPPTRTTPSRRSPSSSTSGSAGPSSSWAPGRGS